MKRLALLVLLAPLLLSQRCEPGLTTIYFPGPCEAELEIGWLTPSGMWTLRTLEPGECFRVETPHATEVYNRCSTHESWVPWSGPASMGGRYRLADCDFIY